MKAKHPWSCMIGFAFKDWCYELNVENIVLEDLNIFLSNFLPHNKLLSILLPVDKLETILRFVKFLTIRVRGVKVRINFFIKQTHVLCLVKSKNLWTTNELFYHDNDTVLDMLIFFNFAFVELIDFLTLQNEINLKI